MKIPVLRALIICWRKCWVDICFDKEFWGNDSKILGQIELDKNEILEQISFLSIANSLFYHRKLWRNRYKQKNWRYQRNPHDLYLYFILLNCSSYFRSVSQIKTCKKKSWKTSFKSNGGRNSTFKAHLQCKSLRKIKATSAKDYVWGGFCQFPQYGGERVSNPNTDV